MPKTAAMADLLERAESLPSDRLVGVLRSLVTLAAELDPDQLVPENELLAFALGFDPGLEDPRQLVGAAVLTDLSVLTERLSARANLTAAEWGGEALRLEELQERWGVSKASLDRYRRLGLVALRVPSPSGRSSLIFPLRAVESFQARLGDRLARANRFQRAPAQLEARIVRRAQRYQSRFRWSLNRAAQRLATRFELSHEGVRQMLLRAEKAGDLRFASTPPPGERERRIAVRAARRGVVGSPEALATRWGRSKPSVRRALNEGRADLLRSLQLPSPSSTQPPAAVLREILQHPAARTGLAEPGRTDLAELFTAARGRTPPDKADETARARALRQLQARAARAIAELNSTTASGLALDQIERDLRWASMLKAALLRPHLGLILQTLEARASGEQSGFRLESLGLSELTRWWQRGLRAASEAVNTFEPAGSGRLAARLGLAVDRAVADPGQPASIRVAGARRGIPADTMLRDWTLALDPWQGWLALDPRVRAVLPRLTERSRRVLALRFGQSGGGVEAASEAQPPMTLAETAKQLGTARVHVARFEREALTEALAHWRDTMPT